MNLFAQVVLSSLEFGAVYALLCLGVTVIYKTSGILNFAAGAIGTVGAYAFWVAISAGGLGLAGGLVVGVAVGAVTGVLVYLALVRWLDAASPMAQIILTLGVLLIIVGLLGYRFGFGTQTLPKFGDAVWSIGPLSLTFQAAVVLAGTLAAAVLVYVIYDRLPIGLRMRAIASDADVAQLVGIARGKHVMISWAIGNALGTLGVIFAATSVGLTPTIADNVLLYVAAALVFGGFGSLPGSLVGGFAIGLCANLISAYLSPNYSFPLLFVFLIAMLYLRPDGLMGEKLWTRP